MGDAGSRLRLTGESISLGANVVFDLSPDHVTIVESGELNVFAAEKVDHGSGAAARGPRHFITSLEPGGAAFGAPETDGLELVGVGAAGTVVREMPLQEVSFEGGEAHAFAEDWVAKVDSGVARYQKSAEGQDLAPPETIVSESDVVGFTVSALEFLSVEIRAADRLESERLVRSIERDTLVTGAAVDTLASVLSTGAVQVRVADDPVLEACRLVAAHDDVRIVEPAKGSEHQGGDALQRILRASRVRSREVTLDDRWWRADAGPILGRLVEGGRPVALLPRGGGYTLVDPGTGDSRAVDEAVAGELEPTGLVFYSPWPADKLTMKDVFAHGLRGSGKDVVRLIAFGLASALLALITPIATATLLNSVIPTADVDRLVVIAGALVLGGLAAFAFQVAQGLAMVRVQTRLESRMQSALWDRLLRLPARFFRRFSVGELVRRALSVDQIRQLIAGIGFSAILGSVFSVTSLVLLYVYDPVLAVVATALLAVAVGVSTMVAKKSLDAQADALARQGNVSSLVVQQLRGIPKLRVTASEKRAFAQWASRFVEQQRAQLRAARLNNIQIVFNATWAPITTLVIFGWIAMRAYGSTDAGSFMAFFTAFGQVLVAATVLSITIGPVLQAVPLFQRARPIFEELPEVEESKSDPGRLTGALELSHIDFRYTEDGPQVLYDLSLRVEPHEFVALVGPSGAGKSSLIRLLLGFEQPEAGVISFDGQDLETLDVDLVRKQIGVVLQTAQLSPGSVFMNIVGASGLTRDDAWRAAAQAGLDQDIREMPMGMETVVTEGGSTFSGGQRQRLLIARALAADPRILLFDEATSALDNVTQTTVTESLNALNVTRMVIAHRLSTVREADRIVVVERGRIVQEGTFDDLMAVEGPFKELAARQLA